MHQKSCFNFVVLAALAILVLALSACQSAPAPAPTEAPAAPATQAPTQALPTEAPTEVPATETPAGPAIGTEENPIIWVVVPSGDTNQVVSGFDQVANMVFDSTGLVIKPLVATEYAGAIEAMCANPPKAQMSSLATFAYLLASEKGCADVSLVSVRNGSPSYNAQIIALADSGIKTLADLKGKTFCRPDALSTSGWIVPSIELKAAGVNPDTDLTQIVDAGSHNAVVAGVYNGDCDAGATYVDARATVETDFPDVMEKVAVIATSAPIPNDGVQFVPSFDPAMRDQIVQALLDIAQTDAGKEALNTAYQWTDLQKVDDTFYDQFRQVLDAAGVSPSDLMQ